MASETLITEFWKNRKTYEPHLKLIIKWKDVIIETGIFHVVS